jgi:hypothetical protein
MDGTHAMALGGRWNPPRSFSVVYLNATEQVARANIDRRFSIHPFSSDDVIEERLPVLIETDVPSAGFVDITSDLGCVKAGLPDTYPLDVNGKEVPHAVCYPIGREAFDVGEPGIACRSAAIPHPPYFEELAWFQRGDGPLPAISRRTFSDWYYGTLDYGA